jgi:hypothetical protein
LALAVPLATFTPSTVRAVPERPPQAGKPVSVDVYLKLRVTVPTVPVPAVPVPPRGEVLELRTADPAALVPLRSPPAPPPATFELIPNWDKGNHAERLIPNYVPGTAQVYLVDQQQAPPAETASKVSELLAAHRALLAADRQQAIAQPHTAPVVPAGDRVDSTPPAR